MLGCNVYDSRLDPLLLLFQFLHGGGRVKASTRIVAEIQGRLLEQLGRDIKGIKEYPKEMHQLSVERSNPKTNPARKSSWGDHGSVTITLTSPACSVHFLLAPFGGDAMIICTLSSRSIRLGS